MKFGASEIDVYKKVN
jgi:hypothetical protein